MHGKCMVTYSGSSDSSIDFLCLLITLSMLESCSSGSSCFNRFQINWSTASLRSLRRSSKNGFSKNGRCPLVNMGGLTNNASLLSFFDISMNCFPALVTMSRGTHGSLRPPPSMTTLLQTRTAMVDPTNANEVFAMCAAVAWAKTAAVRCDDIAKAQMRP